MTTQKKISHDLPEHHIIVVLPNGKEQKMFGKAKTRKEIIDLAARYWPNSRIR